MNEISSMSPEQRSGFAGSFSMDQDVAALPASARALNWIVGIATLLFVIVLAALIAEGRLTPQFLLWTEVCMIAAAAIGLLVVIIAALLGRYST